ncbi:MAG: hypothetical protein LBF40_10655 [Deltaproteobacteria bacterium]|nr:hypothetical protein [Deltaproteobacteria bacterium]
MADYLTKSSAVKKDLMDQRFLYDAFKSNGNATVQDITAVVTQMRKLRDQLDTLYEELKSEMQKNNLGVPRFPKMGSWHKMGAPCGPFGQGPHDWPGDSQGPPYGGHRYDDGGNRYDDGGQYGDWGRQGRGHGSRWGYGHSQPRQGNPGRQQGDRDRDGGYDDEGYDDAPPQDDDF